MNKKIIKKIELDIDGQVFKLTPEQVKKLRSALNELFGEKEVKKEYIPYPQPYPVYPYTYPVYPYGRYWEWKYEPYYYTTSDGSNVNYCSSDSSLSVKL